MREPCISVGYTGTPGDGGHIKKASMYTFTWLPKGYGPSMDERTVCVLFDADNRLESRLANGNRHPLIESIAQTIESHFKAHPEDVVGFFNHVQSLNSA